MFAIVGGTVVAFGELACRAMNFGQHIPGWSAAPYCLHLPADHFIAVFQPVYDRFIREAPADAQTSPDDWPELAAVVDAGCPPLCDLPEVLPEFLAGILRESLDMDVLDAFLPIHDSTPIRYVANTVDHVAVDRRWVAVCGRALQIPGVPPPA